jgi:hypothetical protein
MSQVAFALCIIVLLILMNDVLLVTIYLEKTWRKEQPTQPRKGIKAEFGRMNCVGRANAHHQEDAIVV